MNSKELSIVVMMIGAACMALGTISSLIYLIYQWAVVDLALKSALWSACKLWMWMVGGGGLTFLVAWFNAQLS